MKKIVIYKGLPGCGKTTHANEVVKESNAVIICKDDLRKQNPRMNEVKIISLRNELIKENIQNYDCLICDTNLNPIHERDIRNLFPDVEIVIKDFRDVPVETCIKQDLKRADSVGKDVIMKMYYQYICPPQIGTDFTHDGRIGCYIVDIDGTVAQMNGRGPFDWKKVGTDLPRNDVIRVIGMLAEHTEIVFVSGRDGCCKKETIDWILKHVSIAPFTLHMREEGDTRPDDIVKKEIYDKFIKPRYNVSGVFDDRPRVIRMWEKEGLTVFNVGHNYEF